MVGEFSVLYIVITVVEHVSCSRFQSFQCWELDELIVKNSGGMSLALSLQGTLPELPHVTTPDTIATPKSGAKIATCLPDGEL